MNKTVIEIGDKCCLAFIFFCYSEIKYEKNFFKDPCGCIIIIYYSLILSVYLVLELPIIDEKRRGVRKGEKGTKEEENKCCKK